MIKMKEILEGLKKEKYVVLGIILLAVFFRFFILGSTPPGLYPDVAMNGMDAVSAMETGDYKIFYPGNNGREGLFMNMMAVGFQIFGVGLWQLRLVGAIVGVLTVFGMYLLGKEMFNKNVGLFASLFMATSFWAVNFSRIGFRAILVPLILVWGSYFLFKAFKEKDSGSILFERSRELSGKHIRETSRFTLFSRRINKSILFYTLSAVIFGLGFHTYIAYKAAVLIFGLVFGYKVLLEKGYFKESWYKVGIFGFAFILLAFPVVYYEQTHKDDAARTNQVSVFNPAVNQGNIIKTLAITTSKGLGMYNFYGDPNERHNYKFLPALNPIVGIAFLVGMYWSLKNVAQGFYSRFSKQTGVIPAEAGIQKENKISHPASRQGGQVRNDKSKGYDFFNFLFLILGFFIMMLPSVLTEEGMPHSLRAIGTMPFAFLLAGLGADHLINKKRLRLKNWKVVAPIIGLVILFDFALYFNLWANDEGVRGQFNSNYVEGARYLNSLPESTKKYVIVNTGGVEVDGLPVAAQTYKFITYGRSDVTYLSEEEAKNLKVNLEIDSAVVMVHKDQKLVSSLNTKCPSGNLYEYNSGEVDEFYVYKISAFAETCGGN